MLLTTSANVGAVQSPPGDELDWPIVANATDPTDPANLDALMCRASVAGFSGDTDHWSRFQDCLVQHGITAVMTSDEGRAANPPPPRTAADCLGQLLPDAGVALTRASTDPIGSIGATYLQSVEPTFDVEAALLSAGMYANMPMSLGEAQTMLAPRFVANNLWGVSEDPAAYNRLASVLQQVHDWSDDRLAPNCQLLVLRAALRTDRVNVGTYLVSNLLDNGQGSMLKQAFSTAMKNTMRNCYISGKLVYAEDILTCWQSGESS